MDKRIRNLLKEPTTTNYEEIVMLFDKRFYSYQDMVRAYNFYIASSTSDNYKYSLDKDVLDYVLLPVKSLTKQEPNFRLEVLSWDDKNNLLTASANNRYWHAVQVPNSIPLGLYAFGNDFITKIGNLPVASEINGKTALQRSMRESQMYKINNVLLPAPMIDSVTLSFNENISPVMINSLLCFYSNADILPHFKYREILRALSIQSLKHYATKEQLHKQHIENAIRATSKKHLSYLKRANNGRFDLTDKINITQKQLIALYNEQNNLPETSSLRPYVMDWYVTPNFDILLLKYSRGFAMLTAHPPVETNDVSSFETKDISNFEVNNTSIEEINSFTQDLEQLLNSLT